MRGAEIVLAVSLAVVVYTYLGYPLLIAALARLFPNPVRRAPQEPEVAVVIVAFNEAARIQKKLDTCLALDYPADKLRIVVASDGSTDATHEIVSAHAGRRVTLLAFPERRGKAACINDAIAHCGESIVVLTDARQRLEPSAVRCLVENFADPAVGAAGAELVFEREGISDFGAGVDAYWRYEKFIRARESRFRSAVGVTGALYAVRRDCFVPIPPDTILDDVVIPMNVVMAGRRVVFDDRAKAFDIPSSDPAQEKIRKVRTIAGNYQLLAAHPRFFVPVRDPVFLQLVSHKVMRLLAPFFLVSLLVASAALAPRGGIFLALLVAQLAGYALPLVGALWPAAKRVWLVRLATAFLALNWFAVLGLVEFVRNRNTHLWKTRPRSAAS